MLLIACMPHAAESARVPLASPADSMALDPLSLSAPCELLDALHYYSTCVLGLLLILY